MKPYVAGLAMALLALALALAPGLSAQDNGQQIAPRSSASAASPDSRIPAAAQVSDAESLADFLKNAGYKDVKLIKGKNTYCEFIHEAAGSKMKFKGYGFATEPLVELYCELKMPEKVSKDHLLNVLKLTKDIAAFYRTDDNKMVVYIDIRGNELVTFKKRADLLLQHSQKIHAALNPPMIDQ
jgi:hypothetical protein